jgi:hypothetical protein
VTKSDHLTVREVAAEHPVTEAFLERLVDEETRPREVLVTPVEKLTERDVFGRAVAKPRILHAHLAVSGDGADVAELDLPDAVPAVAAALFDDETAMACEANGEALGKLRR